MSYSNSQMHQLRNRVIEAVGNDFLKGLEAPNFLRSVCSIGQIWMTILIVGYTGIKILEAHSNVGMIFLISIFMATRINALVVQVHEGCHYLICRSKKWNDIVTNFSVAYWVFYDVENYRSVHALHHKHLNEIDDPDLNFYNKNFSISEIIGSVISDFFWITAWKRGLVYLKNGNRKTVTSSRRFKMIHSIFKILFNFILLNICIFIGGVKVGLLSYLLFWIVPFFSIFPIIIRIRIMTEHYANEARGKFVARTTEANFLERYLLGAQMEYHFEHHLFMNIPYGGLIKLHKRLKNCHFFEKQLSEEERKDIISNGYFTIWRDLIKQ